MRSSTRHLPVGATATLEDCAKLWSTLTTDFIPALRVEVVPHHRPNGDAYVELVCCDYASSGDYGDFPRSVWARKEFASGLYLISHAQLFDLLITAYRVIEEYFSTGKDNRPLPQ